MTQKELLYVEDIYNHENLFIELAKKYEKQVKNEDYADILINCIKIHNTLVKKLEKLLSGEANE